MATRKHHIAMLATVFTLALFPLGSGIGQQTHAAPIFNYVGEGVENGATATPTVSSTDLLNGLTGVVTGQGSIGGSFGAIGVVTDGAYSNANAGRFLPLDTTAGSGAVSTWTFTLGSPSSVGEVRVYSAESGPPFTNVSPRNAYDYDLKFFDVSDVQIGSTITVLSGFGGTLDLAGSGSAHVRGTNYSVSSPPDFNQTHYTQVADNAGFLATGVNKLSFTFRPIRAPGNDTLFAPLASATGFTWVTEIDVFAQAVQVIPEPSSFVLAALGLLSLGCLCWRLGRNE